MRFAIESKYRRITAEEALEMRKGNGKVNLWVKKQQLNEVGGGRTNARRGSNTGRRGSNDTSTGRRGSHSAARARSSQRRYNARMDAGILSDDEDDYHEGHSTHSCSTDESTAG